MNERNPGLAQMITIPDLGQILMKSSNYEEAVRNFEQKQFLHGNFNKGMDELIINWLHEQEGN